MTDGRNQLLNVLERTKADYMAIRCYVTKNAVYNWRAGRNGPNPKARQVLNSTYGIDPTDWKHYQKR